MRIRTSTTFTLSGKVNPVMITSDTQEALPAGPHKVGNRRDIDILDTKLVRGVRYPEEKRSNPCPNA